MESPCIEKQLASPFRPPSFPGSIAKGSLSVSSCLFPGRSSNASALEKWNVSASQEYYSSTLHVAAERGLLSHTPKQVNKEILYSQPFRKKKKNPGIESHRIYLCCLLFLNKSLWPGGVNQIIKWTWVLWGGSEMIPQ